MRYAHCVIDAQNLFWRCFLHLSNSTVVLYNGRHVSGASIKKCLALIDRLTTDFLFPDSHLYFLFDNPESKIRSRQEIDVNYKHTRQKENVPSAVYNTINTFQRLLTYASNTYHTGYLQGHEADDLTEAVIKTIPSGERILVVSNDLDWARNISETVDWYDYETLYDVETFTSKFGFSPLSNRLEIYKSLHGDTSDNIPNAVPNMPSDILLAAVNACSSLDEVFAYPWPGKWINKIRVAKPRILRNFELVKFQTPNLKADFLLAGKRDTVAYDHMVTALGIAGSHTIF